MGRRFPAPWHVEQGDDHCFRVKDASGFMICVVLHRQDLHSRGYQYASETLSRDEARRIAKAIARIPEFLKKEPAFVARRTKRHGLHWQSSHPYHVALNEAYVNENYDEIVECCAFNNVPFDPTGEILERIGMRWRTYQFIYQYDAIRFWDKFQGRWMLGEDFIFPERPAGVIPMQSLKVAGAI